MNTNLNKSHTTTDIYPFSLEKNASLHRSKHTLSNDDIEITDYITKGNADSKAEVQTKVNYSFNQRFNRLESKMDEISKFLRLNKSM